MKTILISPVPELPHFGMSEMHLVLSQVMTEDSLYTKHYRRQATDGAYVILDNGAHEGTASPARRLLSQAGQIKARELVLPDVLFEYELTVRRTQNALNELLKLQIDEGIELPRFMIVPQGRDLRDWKTCLQALTWIYERAMREHPGLEEPVIGLSKDYDESFVEGGLLTLVEKSLIPTGYELHLLGWGRDLWQLGEIAARYGSRIRSTDSAKPFVYALAGIELTANGKTPTYPKRPENYFARIFTPEVRALATHNVHVYRIIASG